jgi:DNA-binding transcriptional ArsR family regulator
MNIAMNAFSALGDPTRLRIVEMLAASGQLSVGEIKRRFKISAPAISQHLRILREAKLVTAKIHGQQRLYSLNPQGISSIEGWAKTLRQLSGERYDVIEEMLLQEIVKNKKPKKK